MSTPDAVLLAPTGLRDTNIKRGNGLRIPKTLQAVFVTSNRGRDVHKPPPQKVAYKVFKNFMGIGKKKKESQPEQVNDSKKRSKKTKDLVAPEVSPQIYLDVLLRSRGYSTTRYRTLDGAYYNKPSPLQKASYTTRLIDVIRRQSPEELRKLISCGLSPNGCNQFGESIVHNLCRRGDAEKLQILLDYGCDVQVADDYGRTPMHDACWASHPNFDAVRLLLDRDSRLFVMTDARNAPPLSYVPKENWKAWIEFFEDSKDIYFPKRDPTKDGTEEAPAKHLLPPHSRPLHDPPKSLTPELATMVANGRLTPAEAIILNGEFEDGTVGTEEDDDLDSDSDDDSDDDSYDSEDDSDFDEDEFADLPIQLR